MSNLATIEDVEAAPSKPILDDPVAFMEQFRRSDEYKKAYQEYFEAKVLAPDITEDEKIEVFENSEKARLSFLGLAKNHIAFKYNPLHYSPESQRAINDYLKWITYIKNNPQPTDVYDAQTHIRYLDLQRSKLHSAAASSLQQTGVVPNEKLGRSLIQLIAIDRGLETFGYAEKSVGERAQKVISATQQRD